MVWYKSFRIKQPLEDGRGGGEGEFPCGEMVLGGFIGTNCRTPAERSALRNKLDGEKWIRKAAGGEDDAAELSSVRSNEVGCGWRDRLQLRNLGRRLCCEEIVTGRPSTAAAGQDGGR